MSESEPAPVGDGVEVAGEGEKIPEETKPDDASAVVEKYDDDESSSSEDEDKAAKDETKDLDGEKDFENNVGEADLSEFDDLLPDDEFKEDSDLTFEPITEALEEDVEKEADSDEEAEVGFTEAAFDDTNHTKRMNVLMSRRSEVYVLHQDVYGEHHYGIDRDADEPKRETKVYLPRDQQNLTDQELEQDITTVIRDWNPEQIGEIVRFNNTSSKFEPATIDRSHMLVHYYEESRLCTKNSEQGEKLEHEHLKKELHDLNPNRSAFKFNDRGAQTARVFTREEVSQTDPPPLMKCTENVNHWEVYDYYSREKEKAAGDDAGKSQIKKALAYAEDGTEIQLKMKVRDTIDGSANQSNELSPMTNILRKMERNVILNAFEDTFIDFKYYEDQSDTVKDQDGTLLPLWDFKFEKSLPITTICWHPAYQDLFVVGHGPNEFLSESKQNQFLGLVCWYTLKNPSHPEFVLQCASGVRSLDIHPKRSYTVAAGHQDGSISFWNLGVSLVSPALSSDVDSGRHMEPVWQIKFIRDDAQGYPRFYSVAGDGRITEWSLLKNQLSHSDLYVVNFTGFPGKTISDPGLERCTYLIYYKSDNSRYLVGTESGHIMKCNLDQIRRIQDYWKAHERSVNKLTWNPFHKNIFLSASDDWSVKMWDERAVHKGPIFKYDLRVTVQDIEWAPHSGTIFACALANGRVIIFDVGINRDFPVCVQAVNRNVHERVQTINFNPIYPILLTGDDHGQVMCFKLSPNLRKSCATGGLNTIAFEKNKNNSAVSGSSKGKRTRKGEESRFAMDSGSAKQGRHKADEEAEKLEDIISSLQE